MNESPGLALVAQGSSRWQRFIRRWGVSFLVGEDVLFDAFGDAKVFWRNLSRMKADPAGIRHVVISHDHWDHLAGLWPLLEKHKNFTVYICPGFSRETKQRLSASGAKVVEVTAHREIREGVYSTGPIRGIYGQREIEEQAIVLTTPAGLVLVTGCAHPGITNMVEKVTIDFGRPVTWVIGGFHLKDAAPSDIEKTAWRLQELGVQNVAPLHCTGSAAARILMRTFGQDAVRMKEKQRIGF